MSQPRGLPGGLVKDSDLEASSQYPSLGSFATPVSRLIAETRGVSQGFLSYYHVMPSSNPHHGVVVAVLWCVARSLSLCALSLSLSLSHCDTFPRSLALGSRLWQEGKTNLSHDGLNPAHVPCWWVNNPTLPLGCGWEARKSRHRRIKKQRRFERLAATSQLSLW